MLLAAMAERFPNESQAGLARRAKLQPPRYNNYVQGIRHMDDDAIIGCAQALGLDAKELVFRHRAELADTDRTRSLWRRVSAAAVLVLTLGAAPHFDASASVSGSQAMHYAKWRRKLARFLVGCLSPNMRKDCHARVTYA